MLISPILTKKETLINRTINIDVILHKAGENYVNMHGDANKFTHDCIEVRINKVI